MYISYIYTTPTPSEVADGYLCFGSCLLCDGYADLLPGECEQSTMFWLGYEGEHM